MKINIKAQDFMDYYIKEINKISDKFDKIYEISKKWVYFDGKELKNVNYSPYRSLIYHNQANGFYKISPLKNGEIMIFWEDDDEIFDYVAVTNDFFDDFEKFLKDVENEVSKNNEIQNSKYSEYLKSI